MADIQRDIQAENSIITLGQSALKSAVLINGGAAVAMLAFLGNIWGKEGPCHDIIALLAIAIKYYAWGVLAGAFGSGTTYCTQQLYLLKQYKTGTVFQLITIVVVAISYYLFYLATDRVYNAFMVSF